MRGWIAAVAAGCALTALGGCMTLPDPIAFELRAPEDAEPHAYGSGDDAASASHPSPQRPRRAFDASVLPLAHGQIIVSETGGAMSLAYSLFAVEYRPWVHAGIVAVEGGETVVYDSVGDYVPIPGLAPSRTVVGAVRRVSVERYARGKRIVGLYAPPPAVDRERLVAYAREHHRRGTPFDPHFDTEDASALYCTELVARALDDAGAPVEATPLRDNASLLQTRAWLQLRSHRVYLAGRLVAPELELARWSSDLSDPQIDTYFAIKRELHRRYGAGSRLGHLFRWTGASLRVRGPVQHFVEEALAGGDVAATGSRDEVARVQALAGRHFDAQAGQRAQARDVLPPPGPTDGLASLARGEIP